MSSGNTKQSYGYNGKIIIVDLGSSLIETVEPDAGFYRTYLGGSLIGTYYAFKEIAAGADPLGPDNVLIFAPKFFVRVESVRLLRTFIVDSDSYFQSSMKSDIL